MLTWFSARNFKSIKDMRLEMQPFMVMVGPNGAGKTNVVQALQLLGDVLRRGGTEPARSEGWYQIVRREKRPARGGLMLAACARVPHDVLMPIREGVVAEKLVISVELRVMLKGKAGEDEVDVGSEQVVVKRDGCDEEFRITTAGNKVIVNSANDEYLKEIALGLLPRLVAQRVRQAAPLAFDAAFGDAIKERISESGLEERGALKLLRAHGIFSRWMRYCIEACRVTRVRLDASSLRLDSFARESPHFNLLMPNGQGLAYSIDRLKSHGGGAVFKEILRALQAVYPRIEDISPSRVIGGRKTLTFKERGIDDPLDITSVSDGVLHALALLVMINSPMERGVLAIEEPENAIHPWSVRAIMAHAQKSGRRQMMVTTHSETVVNAVVDPASLFIVEQRDGAGTTVRTAANADHAIREVLSDSGESLGDIWMDGSLGGVPEVGDD